MRSTFATRAGSILGSGLLVMLGGCQEFSGMMANFKPAPATATVNSSAIADDALPKQPITKEQKLDVEMAMARAAENDGNTEQAIQVYEDVLKKDSNRVEACHRLAIVYDVKGDPQKAREYYTTAIKMAPKNADLYCDFGYSCYLQRNWSDAGYNLRRALEIRPDFARAHTNLGLLQARTYHSPEALAEFTKAGCDEASARCNLAFAMALEERWQESRQQYELALAANPNATAARKGLVALQTHTRDGELSLTPQPEPFAERQIAMQDRSADANPKPTRAAVPGAPPASIAPPPTSIAPPAAVAQAVPAKDCPMPTPTPTAPAYAALPPPLPQPPTLPPPPASGYPVAQSQPAGYQTITAAPAYAALPPASIAPPPAEAQARPAWYQSATAPVYSAPPQQPTLAPPPPASGYPVAQARPVDRYPALPPASIAPPPAASLAPPPPASGYPVAQARPPESYPARTRPAVPVAPPTSDELPPMEQARWAERYSAPMPLAGVAPPPPVLHVHSADDDRTQAPLPVVFAPPLMPEAQTRPTNVNPTTAPPSSEPRQPIVQASLVSPDIRQF